MIKVIWKKKKKIKRLEDVKYFFVTFFQHLQTFNDLYKQDVSNNNDKAELLFMSNTCAVIDFFGDFLYDKIGTLKLQRDRFEECNKEFLDKWKPVVEEIEQKITNVITKDEESDRCKEYSMFS